LLSNCHWFSRIYAFNQCERDRWVAAQAAQIPPGAKVLDAGAGACLYRPLFAHCEYYTQDFGQVQDHQLLGPGGYGDLDYRCDIKQIPVAAATFDVVLCTEVLEHVPEPIRAVQEFARLLKPRGKLLLTAPLGSGLHQEPYHFYGGFTPHWYRRFLTEAGFEQIAVEANGGFFKYLGQENLRFVKMLAPWRGLKQFLLFPIWIFSFPLALILPLVGYWGNALDFQKDFTVGYHVTAIRCP
jgi:SAM-dependent methyltransferase